MDDDQELDNLILSAAKTHWQKTAMIISKIVQRSEDNHCDVSYEKVAERIEHLVSENRLVSQGDLSCWRFSEVRLPLSSE